MFKRIDHVAIHVADLDHSIKFYERHFGFKHYFQHAAGSGKEGAGCGGLSPSGPWWSKSTLTAGCSPSSVRFSNDAIR